ncbi:MAG: deoxycytidyl transferase [Trizodia sp. TS-e1964]|nr:MAG: deoxycytidyl transferase [Trizodia sp. TS-e1964]
MAETKNKKRSLEIDDEGEEGEEYGASEFNGFRDYYRRKQIKLQNQDAILQSSEKVENPHIFRGVIAHVNGYTQPSITRLHQLIVSHGGIFLQHIHGKSTFTHIIASNLTERKKLEFRRYPVVKPSWVEASIKAGKLLPWDDFKLVGHGDAQKILDIEGGKVVSHEYRQEQGYKTQLQDSWYAKQVRQQAAELDDMSSPNKAERDLGLATENNLSRHKPIEDGSEKNIQLLQLTSATSSPEKLPKVPDYPLGTQFILPSQVDPMVMAELPEDIRSNLVRKWSRAPNMKTAEESTSRGRTADPEKSRSHSPAYHEEEIPESQIDQETLNALPKEMREEILAHYSNKSHNARRTMGQTILPQSPRKVRIINKRGKQPTTPSKRRQTLQLRDMDHSPSRGSKKVNNPDTITEDDLSEVYESEEGLPDKTSDLLAGLPADIRGLIIGKYHEPCSKEKGQNGRSQSSKQRPSSRRLNSYRKLRLLPDEVEPAHSVGEANEQLEVWFLKWEACGPPADQAIQLAVYLADVLWHQRNMGKATALFSYLAWLVRDRGGQAGEGRKAWEATLAMIRGVMDDTVRERGLGPLVFSSVKETPTSETVSASH